MCTLPLRACALTVMLCCMHDWVGAFAAEPSGSQTPERPQVIVVEGGESHLPATKCRKMIVGPGVNQPDPFPGYQGFVGWECPVRLRDGTMLVSFNAGYWHASRPTPLPQSHIDRWEKEYGPVFDVEAPRGAGR